MASKVLNHSFRFLLLVISMAVCSARGDTILDQTNTALPDGTLSQNLSNFSPLGQSFTPTLTSLNLVNLLTVGGTATLEMDIHSGSISGSVLAVSEPTVIPFSGAPSEASFIFSAPVTLIPGDLYVLEPVLVSGVLLVVSTNPDNYPGGNQILLGTGQPGNDLWFQEGISTPEPKTPVLLGAGLMAVLAMVFFNKVSVCTKPCP